MRWRRWPRRLGLGAAGLCLLMLGAGAILDRLYPPALERYWDRSAVVLDADGGVMRAFTSSDEMWRLPATVDDVPALYLDMLIAYEDRRYYWHPGVDPVALIRATGQMIANGGAVSGASTLTMQVVRLLEPRSRTIGAKLIEMARAIQLELRYSKDEILAMYLTLAPYGGNLEGIQAAAHAYFGKPAGALTPGEAAMLVVLPQSPNRWRPDRDMAAALAAREKVLRRAHAYGVIDARQLAEALEEPLPTTRLAMPFEAPHLTQRLVAETVAGRVAPVIETTIDPHLQGAMESLAHRALAELDDQANLAILVVDNATGDVLAYVGSGDFFAEQREGQVDLVRAIRSPGSTLKPFIYGMAFEDLLLHPQTFIDDTPTRFADYDPTNFDGTYHGRLTVRDALRRSLNVPAVAVLDRLGPARLATRLRQSGMTLAFPGLDPVAALPLALGGVGTTLWDLTQAYGALANGGAIRPLRVVANGAPEAAPERDTLLSPAAAWYLTDILAEAARPDDVLNPAFRLGGARIAFKTGTSYGYRDAWAIGYDADSTIGVWVGRPDGNPSPQRTGGATAAPILFQAFGLLPDPGRGVVGPQPDGVIDRLTDDLPARLIAFGALPGAIQPVGTISVSHDLRIDFPIDGSIVELRASADDLAPLPLVAAGGARPLIWMVDGAPIDSPALSRQTAWVPAGTGQTRITVIDANGESARADIWIQ